MRPRATVLWVVGIGVALAFLYAELGSVEKAPARSLAYGTAGFLYLAIVGGSVKFGGLARAVLLGTLIFTGLLFSAVTGSFRWGEYWTLGALSVLVAVGLWQERRRVRQGLL